jgi:hypothetical protein
MTRHRHISCQETTDSNRVRGRVIVFNVTFNYISVISWRSVLLVEETGVPGENNRPATSH